MRTTISLAHKRDLLSKMTLGELPTEIIKLPGGKSITKFQPLSALKYDAKLSGEEAAKKIDVMGTGLKLSFVLPNRDGSIKEVEPNSIPPQLPPSFLDDVVEQPQEQPEEEYVPTPASTDDIVENSNDSFSTAYEKSLLKNLENGSTYEDKDEND